MTDVGSVSVGVDVNGSDLGEKLAAKIRAAVLPAIAELNRELDGANGRIKNLDSGGVDKLTGTMRAAAAGARDLRDGASEASVALNKINSEEMRKLATSARTAASAVKDVGKNAETAARITSLAADKMIHDYNRVADAADRSAQRQINAAIAVGAANEAASRAGGGGGSGGRGGGGAVGRRGGGGGEGGGFIGGLVNSPGVLNAVALGTTLVGPALLGITNLTGAVQQLGQAGLLLPGVFAAAGSSFATAKIATLGMSSAVKDLYKALGSGDPKELKKANAEIALLPKNVQDTVHAFGDLFPALKDVQRTLADNMFDGVGQQIRDVAGKDIPIFKTGLGGIATAWNGTIKSILAAAGSDSTGGFLTTIFGNTAQAQTIANAAVAPFVHAFGTLAATGSNFLPRLASGVDTLATRFDNFITKSAGNGNLDRWINEGIEAAKNLGTSFLNVGKIITDLTQAAGGDGGFLKALSDGTTKLHEFLSSADGQNKLKDFFASAREEWNQWKPILLDLGRGIGQAFQGLHDWGSTVLPIFGAVTDFLVKTPGLVSGLIEGFVAFRTLNAFGGLLGDLGKVSSALDGVGGKASGLKGKFGGVGALGPVLGLGGLFAQPTDGTQPSSGGAALATLGGGALTGFEIAGPIGAAVGTFVGAVAATTQILLNESNRLDKLRADFQHGLDTRPPGSPANVAPLPSIGNSLQAPGTAVAPNPAIIKPSVPSSAGLPGLLVPQALQGVEVGPFNTGVPVKVPQLQTNLPTDQLAQVSAAAHEAVSAVGQLADGINHLPRGEVNIQNNTPEVIDALKQLGYAVTQLPNGHLLIQVEYRDPLGLVGTAGIGHGVGLSPVGVGKAGGGVLPGYSPGVDNMLWPMSGGEGVVIPEAMRALGPGWLYGINSKFRSGLSRAGYRSGGVVPGDPASGDGLGPLPGPGAIPGDNSVIGLLTQIRDLLAGKGTPTAPLNSIASNTGKVTGGPAAVGGAASSAAGGATIGPFGTPLKPKGDPAYAAAAAAIRSFGGDPEQLIGTDPTLTGPGGGAAGVGNPDAIAALTQFARTGVATPGVDPTSTVARAILSARNKKKGGLEDNQIADLVNSTLTTGTFTGQLDATNTPLIEALLKGAPRVNGLAPAADPFGRVTGAGTGADGITTSPVAGAGIGQGTSGIQSVFVVNFPGSAVTDIPGLPGGANSALQTGAGAGGGSAAGPGGATNFLGKSVVDAATGAVGSTASDVAGSFIEALASGTDFKIGTPTATSTSLTKLVQQGNPLAAAAAFGLNVPDYSRDGGTNGTVGQQGQKFDAKGRMYSDSGSLIDRTMTDLSAQIKASFDQLKSVINQVKDNTAKEVLEPLMRTAVTEGIAAMSNATNKKIGEAQGEAAGPPIAEAVSKATDNAYQAGVSAGAAQNSSGGGNVGGGAVGAVGGVLGNLFDEGGLWESGTYGTNLSGSVERVLSPSQTALFDAGLFGGWNQQPQQQHHAAAEGVDVTSTVGADFFGVSQLPIIGAIINLLVGVLLKLIGVQIDARNTLTDIGKDAREFRGAFQKFDATGRLINDTSGITDRSSTSEQEAADERVRILKLVIEGLIKFIIEKIVIPIGQAVANAAISAGGAAAGAAVNSQAPGAGGIVSALIDSAGTAGVGIVADLASSFTEAATPVITDSIFGAFQSLFPGASTSLFGGGLLSMLTNPLQALLSPLTGGIAGMFATLLGGLTFDDGGVASGVGLMPKATIRPERVLSPSQTQSFDRLVTALERGGRNGGQIALHAPITVVGGGEQAANTAHTKLLSLLGGAGT